MGHESLPGLSFLSHSGIMRGTIKGSEMYLLRSWMCLGIQMDRQESW